MAEEQTRLVLDCGTWKLRAGYAGEDLPFFNNYASCLYDAKSTCFSQENNLMHSGKIVDWDMFENVIARFYEESKRGDAEAFRSLLFLDHFHHSIKDRARVMEIAFEKTGYSRYQSADQTLACIYESGNVSLTVLLMGHGNAQLAGTFEGYVMDYLKVISPLSGSMLIDVYKDKIAAAFKSEPIPTIDYEASFRSVLQDHNVPNARNPPQTFKLADGTVVNLEEHAQSAVEAILDPQSVGCNSTALPQLIYKKLWRIEDFDLRRQMFSRLNVTGGVSSIPSIRKRLTESVQKYLPKTWRVQHIRMNTNDHTITPWIGGSVLGSLSSIKDLWITKQQFAEEGDRATFRRRFI